MKRVVHVADKAGYCFGVRRALDMVEEYLSRQDKKVYSLGPIIHNPQVVEEFSKKGMVPVESIDSIDEGVLVIRSHGVGKDLLDNVIQRGFEVVDATCPFVKNAQKLAGELSENGYQVVIVGEEAHPEVKGIMSYAGEDLIVVSDAEQLDSKTIGSKVGVLAQTTQSQDNFLEVVRQVLEFAYECRTYNTICNATASRQATAIELAASVDVMFVVGGRNSANTRRLAELCRSACREVFHIEMPDEISVDMVRGKTNVGITAGASTPSSFVEATKSAIESMKE